MTTLANIDPKIAKSIHDEISRQRNTINLIASENYASKAILEAQSSVLTNKYAEGYPGRRYYGGCEFIDVVEQLALDRATKLFEAEFANVQPHSGAQANMAAYFATLQPGDTVMGMSLDHGGHLTHGASVNFSSKIYNFIPYGVDRETELIDFETLENLGKTHRPKLIVVGASAYTRTLDFKKFREIADEIGSKIMVDMAHIAGLVAAKEHPSPVPYAELVTSTTHKTLRGPRGGLILGRKEFSKPVNSAVFPNMQGGPLEHIIAAKAVAFHEAAKPEFVQYQKAIKENARELASELSQSGLRLVSGGTDNHIVLVDLNPINLSGKQAEEALAGVGLIVNRNAIPYDKKPPRIASGLRLGTAAITSRGMRPKEVRIIGQLITDILSNLDNDDIKKRAKGIVADLCNAHPVPGIDF